MTRYRKAEVSAANRSFAIQVLPMENGCFVSVSEGGERMGATALSITGGSPAPVTTMPVPAPDAEGALLLKLVAERASSLIHGMAIVTMSVRPGLATEHAKIIMSEIDGMIRNV